MKQIGYTQDSPPCSTFEPRHPCLGYANLQQRQRRLRRGNWCNSVIIALLEIADRPTDIRLFSRHRRDCDRRKQGRFRRAPKDGVTACHRIACAKSAPQVMDYIVAGSSANANWRHLRGSQCHSVRFKSTDSLIVHLHSAPVQHTSGQFRFKVLTLTRHFQIKISKG